MRTARNYIGDECCVPAAADWREIVNPATGETIGRVPMSGVTEVSEAVREAREAFPAWRATPVVQRCRFLFKFKTLLEEHFEEIARIVVQENGKTLDEANIGRASWRDKV